LLYVLLPVEEQVVIWKNAVEADPQHRPTGNSVKELVDRKLGRTPKVKKQAQNKSKSAPLPRELRKVLKDLRYYTGKLVADRALKNNTSLTKRIALTEKLLIRVDKILAQDW